MNTEYKGTKGEVIADIRSGCCAIYLKSREDEKNGIEQDDERNLFFSAKGCKYNGTHWEMDKETQQDAIVFADGLNTIQSCGLLPSQLLKQRDELQAWKDSASTIMNNIDLQKVGKLINVRLGDDISPEILPFIGKLLKQRDEVRQLLEEYMPFMTVHKEESCFAYNIAKKYLESTKP